MNEALVRCPKCQRVISLNRQGGKNMQGEPVMEWHYALGWNRCEGSNLSVAAMSRKLEAAKETVNVE